MSVHPHFLTTTRTELHPFVDEDGPELLHLFREPAVRNFLLDDRVVSPAWMQEEIDDSERRFRRHGAGAWSVRLKGDDEIIGFVAFREFADPPELQLLYGFLPAHWGKGYAAEVTARACEHAFEDLGVGEITAVTDLPNKASAKVLERLGMELMEVTPEGVAGSAHYAISRRMWFERRRGEDVAQAAEHKVTGTGPMQWATFRRWFDVDRDRDREIVVHRATFADRDRLLEALPSWGHAITPAGRGERAPHFMVGSVTVAIQEPREDELALAFPPRPLWYDENGYRAIESLMARIAHVLGKPVRLAVAGTTPRAAITDYDPMSGVFVYHEPDDPA